MGLFNKLKNQALNGFNELQERVNNSQNQQQSVTPPPAPQSQMTPPPAPQPQMTPPPAPQPSQSGNSEGIYGNYIEHLIDMALADGELTEKEKQVLFKKAEAAGIDLDEFEMVLDARLFEKQKTMQTPQPQAVGGAAPKSEKYGDVKKCPSCGAMIESYTTKCPDCGYEFRNIESNASVQKLMQLLMEADEKNGGIGSTVFGQMYGMQDKVVTRKKTIISNFPIPTTKEDIIEFLTIAVPQAKTVGNFFTRNNPALGNKQHNDLASSWKQKCEQIILKARFSMKDDPKTLAEIESYAKELNIK